MNFVTWTNRIINESSEHYFVEEFLEESIAKTLKPVVNKMKKLNIGVPYRDARLFFFNYLQEMHPEVIPAEFKDSKRKPAAKDVNAMVGQIAINQPEMLDTFASEFETYATGTEEGSDEDRVSQFLRIAMALRAGRGVRPKKDEGSKTKEYGDLTPEDIKSATMDAIKKATVSAEVGGDSDVKNEKLLLKIAFSKVLAQLAQLEDINPKVLMNIATTGKKVDSIDKFKQFLDYMHQFEEYHRAEEYLRDMIEVLEREVARMEDEEHLDDFLTQRQSDEDIPEYLEDMDKILAGKFPVPETEYDGVMKGEKVAFIEVPEIYRKALRADLEELGIPHEFGLGGVEVDKKDETDVMSVLFSLKRSRGRMGSENEEVNVDVDEVLASAEKMRKKHPQLRKGQSIMNAIHMLSPELYKKAVAAADAFYDDSKIPSLLSFLGADLNRDEEMFEEGVINTLERLIDLGVKGARGIADVVGAGSDILGHGMDAVKKVWDTVIPMAKQGGEGAVAAAKHIVSAYHEFKDAYRKAAEDSEDAEAKPDYLDLDGDGDKEESMKKAAKDKHAPCEDAENGCTCGGCPDCADNKKRSESEEGDEKLSLKDEFRLTPDEMELARGLADFNEDDWFFSPPQNLYFRKRKGGEDEQSTAQYMSKAPIEKREESEEVRMSQQEINQMLINQERERLQNLYAQQRRYTDGY